MDEMDDCIKAVALAQRGALPGFAATLAAISLLKSVMINTHIVVGVIGHFFYLFEVV